MLGTVVAPVNSHRWTIKTELILGGAATQTVKLYVRRFGLTGHNCVVSDADRSGVLILKVKRWLWTMHFNE